MISSRNSKLIGMAVSIGTCLSIAIYVLGPYIINPFQVKELLQGDVGIHYLGWAFFRYSDWTFPLGQIPDYYYPLGSNIGFTDSIPLMAFLLKPFHGILPTDFQFIGPWLLICAALQAWVAWRLLEELGVENRISLCIGSILLTATPIWFFRFAHPALCAHFLILGSIWMFIKSKDEKQTRKSMLGQYLMLFIVSFVHPYLAVMILGLSAALMLRITLVKKYLKWWGGALSFLGMAGVLLFGWWITGYFSISEAGRASTGLTDFSTNLNAFFNPMENTSRFLPSLPHNPLQYEGYAYLGIGGLLLCLIWFIGGLYGRIRRENRSNARNEGMWILWLMAFMMFVWALSIKVFWGTTRVLRYDLAEAMIPTLSAFRTTGRFVWPLYYMLIGFSFTFLAKKLSTKKLLPILLLPILLVQLIDQGPLWKQRNWFQWTTPEAFMEISEEKWAPLVEASNKILLWPPFEMHHVRNSGDYLEIGYLAARYQKPASIGFVARAEKDSESNYKNAFDKNLDEGIIDSAALYLFLPQSTRYYERSFQEMELLEMDGYIMGISSGASQEMKEAWEKTKTEYSLERPLAENLSEYLKKHESHIILIASLDEASHRLNESTKSYLEKKGSQIRNLVFRGSYIGVIANGELLYEDIQENAIHRWEAEKGKILGKTTFPSSVRIESSGILAGYEMSIQVNGQEQVEKKRGLSIVVIDQEGNLVDKAQFDTYSSSYRWL